MKRAKIEEPRAGRIPRDVVTPFLWAAARLHILDPWSRLAGLAVRVELPAAGVPDGCVAFYTEGEDAVMGLFDAAGDCVRARDAGWDELQPGQVRCVLFEPDHRMVLRSPRSGELRHAATPALVSAERGAYRLSGRDDVKAVTGAMDAIGAFLERREHVRGRPVRVPMTRMPGRPQAIVSVPHPDVPVTPGERDARVECAVCRRIEARVAPTSARSGR